jgi:hypothetical protein
MCSRRVVGTGTGELVREEWTGDEGVDMVWMERMESEGTEEACLYVE